MNMNESWRERDRRVDSALRQTLGEASVPGLSHDFREKLAQQIEKPSGLGRPRLSSHLRAGRLRRLPGGLVTLIALYLGLGILGIPWLAEKLSVETLPGQASVVLLTAGIFSAIASLSVALLFLSRHSLSRRRT